MSHRSGSIVERAPNTGHMGLSPIQASSFVFVTGPTLDVPLRLFSVQIGTARLIMIHISCLESEVCAMCVITY